MQIISQLALQIETPAEIAEKLIAGFFVIAQRVLRPTVSVLPRKATRL
jgi:hypothetical protein